MRAVMLEVPPHLLEERRRLGVDRWDEMWRGELHMVPPPCERHQSLGSMLLTVLVPLVRKRGLKIAYDIGLFAADDDYRVPDLGIYRHDQGGGRGLENAAEMVVELVSPGDESRAKLPWYATRVRELLLVDRDTLTVELFRRADGRPRRRPARVRRARVRLRAPRRRPPPGADPGRGRGRLAVGSPPRPAT